MDFDYIVADPTGNITVLVRSPYTVENRQQIIREAFEKEPSCEQVGFIMPVFDHEAYDEYIDPGKTIRLEMMGYEFCGHATLSAAAWLAHQRGLAAGEEDVFTVDSSGADGLLDVRIRRIISCGDDILPVYQGTVSMPVPEVDSFRGYPLIRFGGISHLLVPADAYTDEEAESAVREYAEELGVPALGMMICIDTPDSTEDDEDGYFDIRPLVYVPGSGTLFWEHGCATGSTAIGWYRYHLDHRNISTEIRQPGGVIHVHIADDHPKLTGNVVFR